MSDQGDLRHQAVQRIQARRGYWYMVGSGVVVSLLMVAIWFLSGRGYFWPIWVFLGFGVAAVFGAIRVFGSGNTITESQIQDEMKKMQ